jgi:UDP:flavonoid glycosyltransferase YjiC (YdhE family)
MICIPISEDQPLVAYRVSDELGLGIRLDFTNMTVENLRTSMHKIFNHSGYYERVERYSEISRKNFGYLAGTKFILDFLENKIK